MSSASKHSRDLDANEWTATCCRARIGWRLTLVSTMTSDVNAQRSKQISLAEKSMRDSQYYMRKRVLLCGRLLRLLFAYSWLDGYRTRNEPLEIEAVQKLSVKDRSI